MLTLKPSIVFVEKISKIVLKFCTNSNMTTFIPKTNYWKSASVCNFNLALPAAAWFWPWPWPHCTDSTMLVFAVILPLKMTFYIATRKYWCRSCHLIQVMWSIMWWTVALHQACPTHVLVKLPLSCFPLISLDLLTSASYSLSDITVVNPYGSSDHEHLMVHSVYETEIMHFHPCVMLAVLCLF